MYLSDRDDPMKPFTGFKLEDFLIFEEPNLSLRVEYIKSSLHPRLKKLGEIIQDRLSMDTGLPLSCQLRSGRWFRLPYWTCVSIIAQEEVHRTDPRRPRLSIYLDRKEAMVGFCQTLWKPEWKKVAEDLDSFANVINSTISSNKAQIAVAHWTDNDRETLIFPDALHGLSEANRLGQDFFFVGRTYPWPAQKSILCSSDFLDEADFVLKLVWPIYYYAFYIRLMSG